MNYILQPHTKTHRCMMVKPMIRQQRQQVSELQFDKFPNPSSFLSWKIRFRNQVTTRSNFFLGGNVMDQSGGNGRFNGVIEVIAISCGQQISRILKCWTRRSPLLCIRSIQNSHFKKKVSLEEQKAQKEDRFLRGRQNAFMIYDYFRVTGAHDTVLDYAD